MNEFAAVALRKLKMPAIDVQQILGTIRAVYKIEPVTMATHDRGLASYERYGFSLYDSVLVAAALIATTTVLYSENLQHGPESLSGV